MIDKKSLRLLSKRIINFEELKKTPGYPDEDRMNKGPVPVIECIEEIPCNPCETICKRGVIKVGNPIINLPRLANPDNCNNCERCVVYCPGLAIFIIDKTFSNDRALLTIPYELLPLPLEGELVVGIDRIGNELCEAEIIKVKSNKNNNGTNIIKLAFPKEYTNEIRSFIRKNKK